MIKSINPTNGQDIAVYEPHPPEFVASSLERAQATFCEWRQTPMEQRVRLLERLSARLENGRVPLAELVTREMGKPVLQARKEVEKCAWLCRHYAEAGASHLDDERISTEATSSGVAFRPLGVVLGIMPWNFPYWQVFRASVPALLAGNTFVLKHAPNVSGCALEIERTFKDAGFPDGAFQTLLVAEHDVESLIAHPGVQGVTLTGSVEAGRSVAARAGKHLKKTVLELGGSDPYLILEDADIDDAADKCVQSRLQNTGQSCIAAKRFIVAADAFARFRDAVIDRMNAAKLADPMSDAADLGPLARVDLRDRLHEQVQHSVAAGARLLLEGGVLDNPGAWYAPAVLADPPEGCPARTEELFGPVATLIRAGNEAEAIRLANETAFGLGAAVFTKDEERGLQIAVNKLEAGTVAVNDFVRSDPRLPFGGVKSSGYGRELGRSGIRAFTNEKSWSVA